MPAIDQLHGLVLSAVATRDEASVRRAADVFGAHHWYVDAKALAHSNDVNIILWGPCYKFAATRLRVSRNAVSKQNAARLKISACAAHG